MMRTPLKILLIEDNADDELLLRRELKKGGLDAVMHRVEKRQEFIQRLKDEDWDLVVSDYILPSFGGLEALQAHRELKPKTPFIIISGTVGEDVAVKSLKAGADDYLLKQNLIRLVPAITRALQNSAERNIREMAEKSLQESRDRMELIIKSVSDFLIFLSCDDQGGFHYQSANPSFFSMLRTVGLNLTEADIVYKSDSEVEDRIFGFQQSTLEWLHSSRREAVEKRQAVNCEHEFRFRDAKLIAEVCLTPIFDADDRCRFMLINGRDITAKRLAENEQRRLHHQLLHAQKMEALGTLSSEIAHEFNNFLGGILGFATIALQSNDREKTSSYLEEINKIVARARQVVYQIHTFAQRQPSRRDVVQVTAALREILPLLQATLPSGIELSSDLEEPGPVILADAGQLQQLVLNLFNNAVQAMPYGGKLQLSVATVTLDAAACAELPKMSPGQFAKLTLVDSGTGMSPEVLNQVFDPFFTTKPSGQGTGLGLAVVQRIVRAYKGSVRLKSQLGQGTTVEVLFPVR
jgi:two-component system, cell cycle sensor histidine kinase and response regulator CckA